MKTFIETINEATLQKDYSITLDSIGGGLKPAQISFETRRNEDKKGSLTLEFYSKGPKNYTYQPSQEILDNMERIDGTIKYSEDETKYLCYNGTSSGRGCLDGLSYSIQAH